MKFQRKQRVIVIDDATDFSIKIGMKGTILHLDGDTDGQRKFHALCDCEVWVRFDNGLETWFDVSGLKSLS